MPNKKNTSRAEEIKKGLLPQHVAVIMDGNGRWANRRLLPRIEGHRAGAKSVQRSIESAVSLGIPYLTLYTFSMENWKRPEAEVSELMNTLKQRLLQQEQTMLKEGISLKVIGERSLLPIDVRETIERLEDVTSCLKTLTLVLALSYGSQQEIVQAALTIAQSVRHGKLPPDEINRDLFSRHLSTAGIPPVDLLIRTSGEWRLSNFLLWQAEGAYLHFTRTLWPDFNADKFYRAVQIYQSACRHRMTSKKIA